MHEADSEAVAAAAAADAAATASASACIVTFNWTNDMQIDLLCFQSCWK